MPAALDAAGVGGAMADQLADGVRQSAGTTISMLRAQGDNSDLGSATGTVVEALSHGFAQATSWSLAVAAFFLALGLLGAFRLWKATNASGAAAVRG